MLELVTLRCPFCGERFETQADASAGDADYVEDCPVCCRPISLHLRTAVQDLNWSIVILLACMIPLGLAVQDTGTASLIANHIAEYLPTAQPLVVATTMLLLAVLITPFIDNVSTAAVLSPTGRVSIQ